MTLARITLSSIFLSLIAWLIFANWHDIRPWVSIYKGEKMSIDFDRSNFGEDATGNRLVSLRLIYNETVVTVPSVPYDRIMADFIVDCADGRVTPHQITYFIVENGKGRATADLRGDLAGKAFPPIGASSEIMKIARRVGCADKGMS